ncbi:MAG: peptidase M28 [Thermoproteota archaeon]|nr:MAG: peptidase M28 [Candidatus Korarchaeota archaeon]
MTMDKKDVEFFGKLSESFGPSGFEREPILLIKERYSRYADEILTDGLGSLILKKKGSSEEPRVILAGHCDEVGFIVCGLGEKGFLKFRALGGWAPITLPAHKVVVRTKKGDIIGTIVSKPPHLMTPQEKEKVPKLEDLFIDVGASSKEELEKLGIRIGDPVAPLSPFEILKIEDKELWLGKAFDDRIGAFMAMEVIKNLKESGVSHPNSVYAAATVQEEVGLRGAETTADVVNPHVGIILEVDISGDVPGVKPGEAPAKMGEGPSIVTWDKSMIPNQPLKEFVIQVAEELKIPYQLSAVSGGTDASRIHLHYKGVPSIVIGIPTRHIHSHNSILSANDVENAIKLVTEVVKRLDKETVDSFTRI